MTASGEVDISAREAEVLALLGERCTNAEIAARLFISVRTVESHVSSLLRKCGVADRRALSAFAAARAATPPRRTGGVAALPVPRTRFVGRRQERDSVLAALPDTRLVMLVGTGGVGKSRLAVELAAEAAPRFRTAVPSSISSRYGTASWPRRWPPRWVSPRVPGSR